MIFALLHRLPKTTEGKHCVDCEKTVVQTSRRKSILTHTPRKTKVIDSDDEGTDNNLPPSSAKIRKMLEILETINLRTKGKFDKDGKKIPAEKTIIFSQFTTMLDLIEPFLKHAGIRYTRCMWDRICDRALFNRLNFCR